MAFRNHLYLLYLSTTFWTWFFLAGLWTNYYQDLSFINALIFVVIFPTIVMLFIGKGLLRSITKSGYFKVALICASYFAFVLLTYDFIYLKLYLGKNFNYLTDYWYLTFFSPIPYLILLPLGYSLDKKMIIH
ncbi:hypothetical protein ACFOG5_06245 [Pedobacter fastidiosus]|uniref:hypothetical protein n=1 Tax=Pedobacter fastidiosus TaxID=2765361 RepID=UPI00361A3EB3